MDRIELAERRYANMIPTCQDDPRAGGGTTHSKLEEWLAQYVVGAVEEIWEEAWFRDNVLWAHRHVAPGAGTDERQLVEAVDQALVTSAQRIRRVSQLRAVQRELESLNSTKPIVAEESVEITSSGARTLSRALRPVEMLTEYEPDVRGIADRNWTDLVCLDDFLGPIGGMMDRDALKGTSGEFVVALNPTLLPVGDFVTRCLIRRVRILRDTIGNYRRLVLQAVASSGRACHTIDHERGAWTDLLRLCEKLETDGVSGTEFRLRDACIALTQAMIEFGHPRDLGWLGLSEHLLKRF